MKYSQLADGGHECESDIEYRTYGSNPKLNLDILLYWHLWIKSLGAGCSIFSCSHLQPMPKMGDDLIIAY